MDHQISNSNIPLYTNLNSSKVDDIVFVSDDVSLENHNESHDTEIYQDDMSLEDQFVKALQSKSENSFLSSIPFGEIEESIPRISNDHVKISHYQHERMKSNLSSKYHTETPILQPRTYHEKYINIYTKGLSHDGNGLVDVTEMNKLVTALNTHNRDLLAAVKLGSKHHLINPAAAWSLDNVNNYQYSRPSDLSSDHMALQMVELYCMSRARDIQFDQYHNNKTITQCCHYLNKITPYNIFRGPTYSDLQGPYLSQFLYRKIGKYHTTLEGYDYMKTWETAISAQSGNTLESPPPQRDLPRYLITGRDLASFMEKISIIDLLSSIYSMITDLNLPKNKDL